MQTIITGELLQLSKAYSDKREVYKPKNHILTDIGKERIRRAVEIIKTSLKEEITKNTLIVSPRGTDGR